MNNNKYAVLPKSFFEAPPEEVAPKLLGKLLVRVIDNNILVGKIVEVEAYLAQGDKAAHNYKGKRPHNKSLFNEAGTAYVHSLRHHHLIDVVTENSDKPGSVLIRAIEPVENIEIMMQNRGTTLVENLTNGPGKLCKALQITKQLDGIDLTIVSSPIFISENKNESLSSIITSKRIGISKDANKMLRFYIEKNGFVSANSNKPHISK